MDKTSKGAQLITRPTCGLHGSSPENPPPPRHAFCPRNPQTRLGHKVGTTISEQTSNDCMHLGGCNTVRSINESRQRYCCGDCVSYQKKRSGFGLKVAGSHGWSRGNV